MIGLVILVIGLGITLKLERREKNFWIDKCRQLYIQLGTERNDGDIPKEGPHFSI